MSMFHRKSSILYVILKNVYLSDYLWLCVLLGFGLEWLLLFWFLNIGNGFKKILHSILLISLIEFFDKSDQTWLFTFYFLFVVGKNCLLNNCGHGILHLLAECYERTDFEAYSENINCLSNTYKRLRVFSGKQIHTPLGILK